MFYFLIIFRYISFLGGEKTDMGVIKPSDIGMSLSYGGVLVLLGFVTSLLGSLIYKSDLDAADSKVDSLSGKSNTTGDDTIFCSSCGKKYSSKSVGDFCEECGKHI
jgi:hypothetical protein